MKSYRPMTTSNSNLLANSCTLQFTRMHTEVFSFCCHQLLPGNNFEWRIFPLPWVPKLSPLFSWQLLTAHQSTTLHFTASTELIPLTVLLITFRHAPHRKYRFPASPLVHARNLLPSNGCCLQSLLSD
jgi:hypothetical protein